MSVPSIQSALQQMQTLQSQATGQKPDAQDVKSNVSFAGELKSSIEKINNLQQISGETSKAFQRGDPNVSLNQMMVDRQKASLAFEMGVQVRNRLVSAYKDVMNMQV